ncbi:deleted in malignant brain tumors 1 protein-like [Haliotis asinina]|uniref:deleted in malignant brain tumors 1 protein-like n=1 Tax=Haliotis asinina TaxID=109174 RepID=UPI0035319E9E
MATPTTEVKMPSRRLLEVVMAAICLCARILGQSTENGCYTKIAVTDSARHTITSEGFPSEYQQDQECHWELVATEMFNQNKTIKLRFSINIEDSADCERESVTVYAFTSTRNTKLAVLCGYVRSRKYEFFIQALLVVFKTGSTRSRSSRGFKMVYQMIEETSCSRSLVSAGKMKRSFHSPLHPQPYPSFQRCTYRIRTITPHHNMRLDVLKSDLSLSCQYAYVLVYDGDTEQGPLLGKWCGSEQPTFHSLSPRLYVVFVSQENNNGLKGFTASYKDDRCGNSLHTDYFQTGEIVVRKGEGNLSPTCQWSFTAPSHVSSFLVTFTDVHIRCPSSSISVYDGSSDTDYKQTWDICDNHNHMYLIPGTKMFIRFDNRTRPFGNSNSSFKIHYRGYRNTACSLKGNNVLVQSVKVSHETNLLTSPGYPEMYPERIQCVWQLQAGSEGDVIKLEVVDLNLYHKPLCYDSVNLYNGHVSDLITIPDMVWCGVEKKVFYSEGENMTIMFLTDEDGIGTGFKIKYQATRLQSTTTDPVETSSNLNVSVTAIVGFIAGIIIIIIIIAVVIKVVSSWRTQSAAVQTSSGPHPQTRDQAAPFLPASSPHRNTDPSAPPPAYQDVNFLPVTDSTEPSMLPPSYEDAISKGMIEKDSETRF